MSEYQGAGWVKRALKKELSPLGEKVADFLGNLYSGIYHIDSGALDRVDWLDTHMICLVVRDGGQFSTTDFDMLTRIVVLAHDRGLRVEMEAAAYNYLRLKISNRPKREGEFWEVCPTLEAHIAALRSHYGPPYDAETGSEPCQTSA